MGSYFEADDESTDKGPTWKEGRLETAQIMADRAPTVRITKSK
jgi:hypothetical protein